MPTLKELFNSDVKINSATRVSADDAVEKTAGAPVEAQIAFLKELVKRPDEAAKFQANPKGYLIDHGVLLDPKVVKFVTNSVLFDATIDPTVATRIGSNSIKDIVDMRRGLNRRPGVGPGGEAAWPAAVAAGAAVVAAAVAVATLVVTLTRHSRPQDIAALSGLSSRGIKLPGGKAFVARDAIVRRI